LRRAAFALALATAALGLAGCGDIHKTEAQCQLEATRLFANSPPSDLDADGVRISDYVKTCMQAKGYRLKYTVACVTTADGERQPDCYERDFGPRDLSQSSAVAAAQAAQSAAAAQANAEAASAIAAANSAAVAATAAANAAMRAADQAASQASTWGNDPIHRASSSSEQSPE
jgi:hypothetical protein